MTVLSIYKTQQHMTNCNVNTFVLIKLMRFPWNDLISCCGSMEGWVFENKWRWFCT